MKIISKFFLLLLFFALFFQRCKTKSVETEVNTVEQWLTFEGNADAPRIVLVSGDEEYRSEEALPQLAKILSNRHGFNCTVLFAQDTAGIVNPNYLHNIPGLESLKTADLMIIFTHPRPLGLRSTA